MSDTHMTRVIHRDSPHMCHVWLELYSSTYDSSHMCYIDSFITFMHNESRPPSWLAMCGAYNSSHESCPRTTHSNGTEYYRLTQLENYVGSFTTFMRNESCPTYDSLATTRNESCVSKSMWGTWLIHVLVTSHVKSRVMSHIWLVYDLHAQWVMTHIWLVYDLHAQRVMSHIWLSHIRLVYYHAPWVVCVWDDVRDMTHLCTRLDTNVRRVMSHIMTSPHMTMRNESCPRLWRPLIWLVC